MGLHNNLLLFAVCLFLAGPTLGQGWYGNTGGGYQSDQIRTQPSPAQTTGMSADVSSKQRMLQAFFQLFRSKSLADLEQQRPPIMLGDELAEEEADPLSAVTRYVGVGYNLLKGSPDGDFQRGGVDPGILTTRPVFDFTYKDQKEAFFMETTVKVPDQVNFQPVETRAAMITASVYSGAKSYQNSLNFGINAKAAAFGFQFGLSGAIKSAKEETDKKKNVIRDKKEICNLGHVRYLTDSSGIHTISKSFYDRVSRLPKKYSAGDYMQFIRDWGTHLIVEADVGTKNISRFTSTYEQVYEMLKNEKSGGFSVGGNVNGNGGDLGLDIGSINANSKSYTDYATHQKNLIIGTKENPFPIHLTLWNISEALKPQFWNKPTHKSLGIDEKKRHLERALADYADYEGVDLLTDPMITVKNKWPNSRYALPAPEGGCPKGWSSGHRTQGTGDDVDVSSGITSRLDAELTPKTIKLHYCVKEKIDGPVDHKWPEGSYCIAKKGNKCPDKSKDLRSEGPFKEGKISWNDYKSFFRKSLNKRWGSLPEGEYNKNTIISFCCRNDGRAASPMILPITHPFVLYRYGGKCQAVKGTDVREDFIKFDDTSRIRSKNWCSGEHPDDDNCKGDHRIYFCHYRRKK